MTKRNRKYEMMEREIRNRKKVLCNIHLRNSSIVTLYQQYSNTIPEIKINRTFNTKMHNKFGFINIGNTKVDIDKKQTLKVDIGQ